MKTNLVDRYCARLLKDLSVKKKFLGDRVFRVYPYLFSPRQLITLANEISRTSQIPGCILEVGCAWGATTVFLRRHMKEERIEKQYFAIDTFSGFVDHHIQFEIDKRGKHEDISKWFVQNKKSWFDYTIECNQAWPVNSIQMDATQFSYSTISPIAFALIDIDLYVPIASVLPKIYEELSPGGTIIVDDCKPNEMWDGALQAYQEFVDKQNHKHDIREGKLGFITK